MSLSGISINRLIRLTHLRLLFLIGILVFPVIQKTTLMGQGNLLITPRRVVFEGNKKNEELNLANTGNDTATYNVSLVQYRMKEDGSLVLITEPDPGQNFADKYVRFFPRTVTLAPNEAQVVKMQLFRANDLPAGEYRSHIYFRAVPRPSALGAEEKPTDTTTLSVKLVPIFGITIPVIIRVGSSTAKASLSDLSLKMVNDTIPQLSLTFNRSGNMSVYGDIEVNHVSSNGSINQVGYIRGLAVYTPNLIRNAKIDLRIIPGLDYRSGKLQITYVSQTDVNPVKLATAELDLN